MFLFLLKKQNIKKCPTIWISTIFKMKNGTTKYFYAVLNINNMMPIPENCLTQLKYSQVEIFNFFSTKLLFRL